MDKVSESDVRLRTMNVVDNWAGRSQGTSLPDEYLSSIGVNVEILKQKLANDFTEIHSDPLMRKKRIDNAWANTNPKTVIGLVKMMLKI